MYFINSKLHCGKICSAVGVRKNFTVLNKLPLGVDNEIIGNAMSSLGRYVFGSEISYNKAPPPRLPGLAC
jgi:hypothetical protein